MLKREILLVLFVMMVLAGGAVVAAPPPEESSEAERGAMPAEPSKFQDEGTPEQGSPEDSTELVNPEAGASDAAAVLVLETEFGNRAEIVYQSQSGYGTITLYCPGGGTISCTGNNPCGVSYTCPDGNSTCPGQGGQTDAVNCDGGPIEDHCPCPEVCYGCGTSCSDDWQCASVCSCGPPGSGFCDDGQCECLH